MRGIFARVVGEGMEKTDNLQNIVLLIDAENTRLSSLEDVIMEISTRGRIVVKRAYADWKRPTLKNWEPQLIRLAIKAVQQFNYVSGKNTSDIALVIDAMDLLHEKFYDAFVLVSSDSDFTPLAIRLNESGVHVIGVGDNRTLQSFRNACDEFILLESLSEEQKRTAENGSSDTGDKDEDGTQEGSNPPDLPTIGEIHNLLKIASDKYQDDDGFVNVSAAGNYIKRVRPDFYCQAYGFSKLSELVEGFPEKYEVKRYSGKGTANIVAYKIKLKWWQRGFAARGADGGHK